MVVQHNLQAMNANRMLNITTKSQAGSTEKLSSGYKINRAADDAAGLSISEKMRKQIRGLSQASANAQDGISAVQTAEGALTEVHDMLQRMNELAVQAANGTNSESDRQSIQDEISQLTTEIDRVSETTKFNETYLLKGNGKSSTAIISAKDAGIAGGRLEGASTTKATFTIDALKAGQKISIGGVEYTIGTTMSILKDEVIGAMNATDGSAGGSAGIKAGSIVTVNGSEYKIATKTNYNESEITVDDFKKIIDEGATVIIGKTTYVAMTDLVNKNNNKGADGISDSNSTIISTKVAYQYIAQALQSASSIGTDPGEGAKVGTKEVASADKALEGYYGKKTDGVTTQYVFTISTGKVQVDQGLQIDLHVGADADGTNKIAFNMDTMSSKGLGIAGLNVKDRTGAKATFAIDAIAEAISKVSAQRSTLGAIQNRLDHTIKNLDNVVENTTSAESEIRDTDMAEEMVSFTKNNILAQAGQSMLAQANQSNQGVLSLLG